MITFFVSLTILIVGGIFYSKVVERIMGVDAQRQTPAYKINDGVDYVPLPWWKVFLIQFLNIAGLGPIFGAVSGAMWGPVAFVWIVFGCVFAGAVHDFFSGMLSIKHNGISITEIVGIYLGNGVKQFMRLFTVLLMVLVGAVFVTGPAGILGNMTTGTVSTNIWIVVIFVYYFLATMLPIDKIIGKIYPVFGFVLIFMALSIVIAMFTEGYHIPELSFQNFHSDKEHFPVFPMMCITIACGAISGFHSTQSPLMARCLQNEKSGRFCFYGAMITEGIVALIWAAIGMAFYGDVQHLNEVMNANDGNAAIIVTEISKTMLGKVGSVLVLLGVVFAPITSGDTAFRSARLIVADFLHKDQSTILRRLLITIPLFAVGILITQINFGVLWRYFAWSNQTLSVFVLWAVTVFLTREKKCYWITFIPAVFMTVVCSSYILLAPEGFSLPYKISIVSGLIVALAMVILYKVKTSKSRLGAVQTDSRK